MPILVNIAVMPARRNMKLSALAKAMGITLATLR